LKIDYPGILAKMVSILHLDVWIRIRFGQDGIDFTLRCLDKDPAKRWSCEQLVVHSFFKNFSFKITEEEEISSKRSYGSGGMLLPHLPNQGISSQNGSPDVRMPGSNLSLGSSNRKFDHLPTI